MENCQTWALGLILKTPRVWSFPVTGSSAATHPISYCTKSHQQKHKSWFVATRNTEFTDDVGDKPDRLCKDNRTIPYPNYSPVFALDEVKPLV